MSRWNRTDQQKAETRIKELENQLEQVRPENDLALMLDLFNRAGIYFRHVEDRTSNILSVWNDADGKDETCLKFSFTAAGSLIGCF